MKKYELASKLRSGQLDLFEYLEELCRIIEAQEPKIHALIPGTFDRKRLLSDAKALVERYPEPHLRPALFGIPVGIKDIIRTDGFPTRCGSALPAELFEGAEADCVSRLRRDGAIIAAKTVTTEFAYNEPGPTRNPHNLEHTPGGSSSGSAAAVASGFFPLALGSQTVGSVIRPAAFCGIVGFKPSFGRISMDGVIPYSNSADHLGILCKEPAAIDAAMAVLTDNWRGLPDKLFLEDVVFGVPDGPYLDRTSANGRVFFEDQLERMRRAGCNVKRIQTFSDFNTIEKNHRRLIAAEMARYHSPWFEANRHLYRPRTLKQIEKGLLIKDDEIEALRKERCTLRQRIKQQMREEGIWCWICPPATDHAPKGLQSTGDAVMNLPWTSAGLPVVTLPAGKDRFSLPQGVQIVSPFMEDETLVQIADMLFEKLG